MTIKVGINGFGRIGRLVLRAAWQWPEIEFIQINDPAGDAKTLAHLLNFDSVHGRWKFDAQVDNNQMMVCDEDGEHTINISHNLTIAQTDWSQCDVVVEASGVMKTTKLLNAYLAQGVKRVMVTAPVKEEGTLNIVMGVNHHLYNKTEHKIVTAASCTTNCLAPVVKVLQDSVGIKHGSMTTIHDITNTQTILDAPHKDLRRARACGQSLIPTTTGSATAITHIFPELKGKLNGHAVRVPLANASITDCVFELNRAVTVKEINQLMATAAQGELKDILGYEERPLVSVDYKTDPRSCIVDALSTMVVNDTQLKMYLWYDNEWGYANRAAELMLLVGRSDINN
ncbi:ArsJ-associated glyceraldehyde-3-phosphate dehydrogenase [Colwellia hornerae]|uniref:Glyceraldehyde-3-phosphate dehydrogenase n=1 Tax=Colwellia hornerae TaxID=89402 RepID=A0A5C6QDW7_9GAMM|nr:ArsJ-associated glyceraldehyde-3-phosphate dehydrogenase [Colwellia hornerae]TWX51660.1 ArsJ-associated glyceraldehyde-3-phosphate dehydrogenase [Colwellia hornerae]TWX57448.1 ArsJ-associated glyceraldehyde-3-phosphate dehydrogenase [Colwellia hornerae]TWX66951.1 ArsJ-associated glyceraldehyde-3-phosphate dehydrogenase [Colwellia hornerae]